jgi:hypothetical protein
MACNCKRKRAIESKFGEPIPQTWIDKLYTIMLNIVGFLFVVTITTILTPIMIIVAFYKMFFTDNAQINLSKIIDRFLKE